MRSDADFSRTVSINVDGLIRIFPPAVRKIQEQLAAIDLQDISPPAPSDAKPEVLTLERENLAKVRDISAKVDSIMQQVANDEIPKVGQRHQYKGNIADQTAKVFYGDARSGAAVPAGPGHSYTDNKALGQSRVQYGDRIDQPDFFD